MESEYEIRDDRSYYEAEMIHLWVKPEGDVYRVGIDDMTQKLARKVSFVFLKSQEGDDVKKDEFIGSIETAKIVLKIVPPMSGKIVRRNSDLEEDPDLINISPYDKGWIFEMTPDDPEEYRTLLTPKEARVIFTEEQKGYE